MPDRHRTLPEACHRPDDPPGVMATWSLVVREQTFSAATPWRRQRGEDRSQTDPPPDLGIAAGGADFLS